MQLLFNDNTPFPEPIITPAKMPVLAKANKLPYMKGLPPGLTPAQKRLYKTLVLNNGYLVLHKTKSNRVCFRMLDGAGNAIKNLTPFFIKRMISLFYLTKKSKTEIKYYPTAKPDFLTLTNQSN